MEYTELPIIYNLFTQRMDVFFTQSTLSFYAKNRKGLAYFTTSLRSLRELPLRPLRGFSLRSLRENSPRSLRELPLREKINL